MIHEIVTLPGLVILLRYGLASVSMTLVIIEGKSETALQKALLGHWSKRTARNSAEIAYIDSCHTRTPLREHCALQLRLQEHRTAAPPYAAAARRTALTQP